MLSADLYFSIRSPFSYIALQQLDRVAIFLWRVRQKYSAGQA